MKEIKYQLSNTAGFNSIMNYLQDYISEEYAMKEDATPEYLICSCFGKSRLIEDTIRILYIGENLSPDFNIYDYVIGFDDIEFGDRYIRYPIYALAYREAFLAALEKHKVLESELKKKDKFCSFVVSNGNEEDIRTQFFLKLNEYKRVESGGRFMNNIGYSLTGPNSKELFQRQCKFAIAFENSSTPGYTTEKLLQAWHAGAIPIYWGNPEIAKEFNTKAFINCHEYKNFDAVIERIKEIDNNDDLYMAMIREPILYEGSIAAKYVDMSYLKNFLDNIFGQDKQCAFRRTSYFSRFGFDYANQQIAENESVWSKVKKRICGGKV